MHNRVLETTDRSALRGVTTSRSVLASLITHQATDFLVAVLVAVLLMKFTGASRAAKTRGTRELHQTY